MQAKLTAKTRANTGKNHMNRLRVVGDVPGVVLFNGKATPISFAKVSIQKLVVSGLRTGTVIDLDMDGKETNRVLVKEVQRHPVSGDILHVDFYQLTPGKKVLVNIPIRPQGTAIGIKNGGAMEVYYQSLKVKTIPEKLKETIDVDVTALDVGDGVRLSKLNVDKEWDVRLEGDPMILKVARSRMVADADAIAGADAAANPTQATIAAGAAAAAAAAPAGKGAAKGSEKK